MPHSLRPTFGLRFFDEPAAEPAPLSDARPPRIRAGRLVRRCAVVSALAVAGAGTLISVSLSSTAAADPSANDWYRLRICESTNNYSINTGNSHYGAYQFDLSTWRSVGGSGYPHQASPAEQDARALRLYRMRGWQPWQCAGILGLREDSDARSGRYNDIVFPGGPTAGPPAWPGTRTLHVGDSNAVIAQWQRQMRVRGASALTGTGVFGQNTLGVVRRIQSQNGLAVTGLLGPATWTLAWTGDYRNSDGPAAPPPVVRTAPAWPGTQSYSYGDRSTTIARWQAQMHTRGSVLTGTGVFGPNTLAAVKRIQRLNGLGGTGILGPRTWALAWTGAY